MLNTYKQIADAMFFEDTDYDEELADGVQVNTAAQVVIMACRLCWDRESFVKKLMTFALDGQITKEVAKELLGEAYWTKDGDWST